MRNWLAVNRASREFGINVQRIEVARLAGKIHDIRIGNGSPWTDPGFADIQIFKRESWNHRLKVRFLVHPFYVLRTKCP
jgi:hypothetical protein